jgi:hypothetical protein
MAILEMFANDVRPGSIASVEQCPWHVGFTHDFGSIGDSILRRCGPIAIVMAEQAGPGAGADP